MHAVSNLTSCIEAVKGHLHVHVMLSCTRLLLCMYKYMCLYKVGQSKFQSQCLEYAIINQASDHLVLPKYSILRHD